MLLALDSDNFVKTYFLNQIRYFSRKYNFLTKLDGLRKNKWVYKRVSKWYGCNLIQYIHVFSDVNFYKIDRGISKNYTYKNTKLLLYVYILQYITLQLI